MPNPPKPVELKRKLGNPGGRPLPSPSLAIAPARQQALYDLDPGEALDVLLAEGQIWLGSTDSMVLGMLREALEERRELRPLAMSGNDSARRAMRELEKQITQWCAALGFDPASRGRLGLAEVRAASTLEQIKAARRKG